MRTPAVAAMVTSIRSRETPATTRPTFFLPRPTLLPQLEGLTVSLRLVSKLPKE